MAGLRSMVLPPNLEAFDRFFEYTWVAVHTLTAAVLSQNFSTEFWARQSKKISIVS
jgi:hypothetical protein